MGPSALFRAGMLASAALAALNLLAGLAGGLLRLGWPLPAGALADHGAVMVGGVFGTLIALERAVALQRSAGLLAPLAAGLGGLLAWAAGRPELAAPCWGAAALLLFGLYLWAGCTRAWSLHLGVEAAAALAWGLGTLAWARGDGPAATLGWMAFLVGTIAGERRELMQFVRLSTAAQRAFLGLVAAGAAAVLGAQAGMAGLPGVPAGGPQALWWAACAGLAVWLLRHDLAPRLGRREGWVGHTGHCLTIGYGWLLVGAVLGALGLLRPGGAAAVAPHAVLLGFVFAMVFGHAPIMLPALARLRPAYTRWARAPLWLLSASLLLRIGASEAGSASALAAAGAAHALAILGFAAVMAGAVRRGLRAPAAGRSSPAATRR
ncbi:MAG TPA: hypothetical protein VNV16_11215 [Methylibium sp.]|nr:hypothetical protein [Methylibium sp.]